MQPWASCPASVRAGIVAVLTDIDDTLTEHGRLPAVAYAALERLRAAGLRVVPVTGRPAGWCDLIARQWPVDAVVGENGAFYFRYDEAARRMIRRYAKAVADRGDDRTRLDAIAQAVLTEIPGTAIAADQAYREADLAIDFCEDVPALPPVAVQRIVDVFHRFGATAKVSSIHVNGWFGGYDKLSTSRLLFAERFGIDLDAARDSIVYVGDSPNDAPMFHHFPQAVGVANVRTFANTMTDLPHWITTSPGGRGFAEVADALIEARTWKPNA
ncbi:MAG: HAD-IIB family hydrolase [Burkholderiales bacterium]|nr:HAD-IIB family hydrolase [Burkholderiales bacterium]